MGNVLDMEYDQKILDFWLHDELNNIVPDRDSPFPEGFNVHQALYQAIGNSCVVEVGCGYGRLAEAFPSTKYQGYDINPICIEEATEHQPDYTFHVSDVWSEYPVSDWILLYTVALHVPDGNITDFFLQVTKNCQHILVAEIMGRERWKQPLGENDLQFAFNRDESEYVDLLELCGFTLMQDVKFLYTAYEDCEITFLTFERAQRENINE